MIKVSYPKHKIDVLLLEGVHEDAVRLFENEGYRVTYHTSAMTEDELCKAIKNTQILGLRSKTQVTKKVLEHGNKLLCIGAFCIGTNQINLDEASKHGVAVFNAPYSNTRSVVELAIAEMILLIRNLPDKMAGMHTGKWEKSAENSHEIRGKKLGIVGYGNIGSQLSVLAEAMGLNVFYYDVEDKLPLGNATHISSLKELFETVDIVSLHIDGRPENTNLIGSKELAWLKPNAVFLNLARGQVVDTAALKQAIDEGKILGAGVDVYPTEPKSNDELFEDSLAGVRNTILTPHIGGSTIEAQEHIGNFVPNKIIDYINKGNTLGSVNLPNVQLPNFEHSHRFLHIHYNQPNIMATIANILAKHDINIDGQFLKTTQDVGYVITDINKAKTKEIVKELKAIPGTIRFRVLY